MFVAREEELSLLGNLLHQKSSSFMVVYGRRRIGKTETVRHFIKTHNLKSIEITGVYGANKASQINSFVRKIKRISKNEVVSQTKVKEWQDVFFLLEDYIESQEDAKKVIFLDEFPWLDTHKSGFLSAFSEFWNDFCTRRDDIVLIVCGSATSYMINKIVRNRKTLHNRVTHKINMQAFKLGAVAKLLSLKGCRYSQKSIVDTYMVLGGVAKYINDMDCHKQQLENIAFQCFDNNGLLVYEYEELYESLFKNSEWHYKVMTLLSNKWSGYIQKDIAKKLKTSASVVKDVLEELELSGFLSSVPKFGQKSREKIYRATDSFSYFYNKWMKNHPNTKWQTVALSQPYKVWSGFAFENICHIHIDEIKQALGVFGLSTQLHYWNYIAQNNNEKGAQVDMLLEYTDGSKNIDIIECKYYDDVFVINKKYYEELRTKMTVFNKVTKNRYNIRLIFVTTFGVEKNEYYNELVHHDIVMDELLQ